LALPVSSPSSRKAIVVSPNSALRERVVALLQASNWSVEEAVGGAEALTKLDSDSYSALVLDVWLPDLDVSEVSEIVHLRYPGTAVYRLDESAALVSSPDVASQSLASAIAGLIQDPPQQPKTAAPAFPGLSPAPTPSEPEEKPLPDMIGSSAEMRQVYRLVRMVASRPTTALILGGTGTGKELVAHALHNLGSRSRQPFITVNCAAIPEALLEAELLGYNRGAFTGAWQTRIGRLQAADGGTLFLDEIGDLPASMQAKLLRFLQEGEVQRLGSSEVIHVDVRVIAATNADLVERVRQKAFREDLYYRLSVFPIHIEPLQRRVEDILPLSQHFLTGFCRDTGAPSKRISTGCRAVLERHSWPGNVRELQHVMERAFILSGTNTEILREHIRIQIV
jgi:DNA-binding NtrC family response regulator